MFADDSTTLLTHDKLLELQKMMTIDRETLNRWFEANPLVLNIDKTKFVLFHNTTDVFLQ